VGQVRNSESSIFKDETNLFVKVVDKASRFGIFEVSGGDISKGALAIDTKTDLETGLTVQFLRRSANPQCRDTIDSILQFGVIEKDKVNLVNDSNGETDRIIAYSEDGVIVSNLSIIDSSQIFTIPGINVYLETLD
jgi:hypothetical protein